MKENSLVSHIRNVNKILNWVYFILAFVMLIAGIATNTISSSIIALVVTIVSAFVAFYLRHKKKDNAATYVLVASALAQVIPLIPVAGGSAFILAMLPISIATLYFINGFMLLLELLLMQH